MKGEEFSIKRDFPMGHFSWHLESILLKSRPISEDKQMHNVIVSNYPSYEEQSNPEILII